MPEPRGGGFDCECKSCFGGDSHTCMAREWPKFLILMGNEGGISKHTHTMEMDQIEGGRERCVQFTLPNNLNELHWVCFICTKFDAEWLLPCCGGQCASHADSCRSPVPVASKRSTSSFSPICRPRSPHPPSLPQPSHPP